MFSLEKKFNHEIIYMDVAELEVVTLEDGLETAVTSISARYIPKTMRIDYEDLTFYSVEDAVELDVEELDDDGHYVIYFDTTGEDIIPGKEYWLEITYSGDVERVERFNIKIILAR
jgi:hypothetical protein